MIDFETSKKQIEELVEEFKINEHIYKTKAFDEENTKINFINKFFIALGWDVTNEAGIAPQFKDVEFEDTVLIGGKPKAPDYCFRIGGARIFFVEAKKPSVDIEKDRRYAFQLKRYTWSAHLPLGLLTDFEELAIYEPKNAPKKTHNTSVDRIKYYHYSEYVDKWDEIYNLFSKEAVLTGKFDAYVKNIHGDKKGTSTVDSEFLKTIEEWRLELARNIALRNKELTVEELNFAVQLIIDRIIFLRIAEDRGIEKYGQLKKLTELASNEKDNCPVYEAFIELCKKADVKYNSGLFHFSEEKDISLSADTLTPTLHIDDGKLKKIIDGLYYPDCPYEFSMISTEILGNIYEQFLGKVIRLTDSHQAKVKDKPEVKKAGGVFYTPQYIVEYIVDNTIGELLKGKTPNQVSKLRFVDPSCGSGSFLLGTYQKLLDWHIDYYSNLQKPPKDVIYIGKDGIPRLTIQEKKRILLNNIYGVDIDSQAVEVTKLSLLLKVLEDTNKDVLEAQQKLIQQRALPYLGDNIRCGNSLIGSEILDSKDLTSNEIYEINPFDWEDEFPEVFENGGFDAVIGNPPYVLIQPKDTPKYIIDYYKNKFEVTQYKIDLYHLFYEKGINIIKNKGFFSYITPNPYLMNIRLSKLRKFILDNSKIKKIITTGDDVFDGAKVDTAIIILLKENNETNRNKNLIKIYHKINEKFHHDFDKDIPQKTYLNEDNFVFNINITSKEWDLLEKIDKFGKLKDISRVSFGLQTKDKSKYVKDNPINEKWKPCIDGKNISPYHISFSSQYFLHDEKIKAGGCWDDETHNTPIKIVIRQIGKYPIAAIDTNKYYSLNTIYNITSLNEKYDYKYILAIINSNLLKFFWKSKFYDSKKLFPKIKKAYLDKIPIPELSSSNQKPFIELVDNIVNFKQKIIDSRTPKEEKLFKIQLSKTEDKLNNLIYELYNLTEDEINIIENEIKK